MRLNKLDYIILLKSFKDKDFEESIRAFLNSSYEDNYTLLYISEAFDRLNPDKELPDILKKYFKIYQTNNITLYICDYILNKNKNPPDWAIEAFFENLDYNKKRLTNYNISSCASDVIDYYLKLLNFDDIDMRFFYNLKDKDSYHATIFNLDRKINIEKNKNNSKIKKILDLPIYLEYERMDMFVLIKQIFQDMYDVINVIGNNKKTSWMTFGEAILNTGTLDKWIKYAIEKHNLREALTNEIMSLGIEYKDLPDSLKEDKVKKESFSFKSYFMR
jgi:hypothetical protein